MSFDFATSSSKLEALKIYKLDKKNSRKSLTSEQLNQLACGYRNEDQNELIYFVRKDKDPETKWFINDKQEFHLMKLISKLENNIKETDEQLMNCKSNLNKSNLNNVYALQMNEIFWVKNGNLSQTLIENYLEEKLKKNRTLKKNLSALIESNLNALVILKDLMQSRLHANFEETIVKIEENFS